MKPVMASRKDVAELLAIEREEERRDIARCVVVTSTSGTWLDFLLLPSPLVACCYGLTFRVYPLRVWEDFVTGFWDGKSPARCRTFASVELAKAHVDELLREADRDA